MFKLGFRHHGNERISSNITWYAYKHVNGHVHVKRYGDDGDLEECRSSSFVKRILPPYGAINREEAMRIAREHFRCS